MRFKTRNNDMYLTCLISVCVAVFARKVCVYFQVTLCTSKCYVRTVTGEKQHFCRILFVCSIAVLLLCGFMRLTELWTERHFVLFADCLFICYLSILTTACHFCRLIVMFELSQEYSWPFRVYYSSIASERLGN